MKKHTLIINRLPPPRIRINSLFFRTNISISVYHSNCGLGNFSPAKTKRKQGTYAAIIALFGMMLAFTACDSDKNDPCNCNPKAHLGIAEECNCGGKDCNCTLKVYGTIADISIYRDKNVTDAQATIAEANIQTGYAEIKDTVPGLVENITTDKVSALHITLNQTACLQDTNGKYIIYLAHDLAAPIDHSGESIGDWLAAFNDDYLGD